MNRLPKDSAEQESQIIASAYDFIEHSLEQASQAKAGDIRRWKFAIVAVATSVELLLKERLRQEHPVLIYTKIDEGMRNTVSPEIALARLKACNVAIDSEDTTRLNRAREIRNSIIHFSTQATAEQLRATYVDMLEFAHVFHEKEFNRDLHQHLDETLLETNAFFISEFRREFIEYQGSTIHRTFPSELVEAQYLSLWSIDGEVFERIPYGDPRSLDEGTPTRPCHDCAALPGQLHVPWCDWEACPRCGGQALGCACNDLEKDAIRNLPDH